MSMNMSGPWNGSLENSSCDHNMSGWEKSMDTMYTYFYLVLFIPGLLLNTTALWVLCRYISKKTKAVIFMINLSVADLAHTLSLPLRIYYYFTHSWPFGRGVCLFCFYLKFLNMYAAIVFLVCISVQRCVFLLDPFVARRWRRRYDLLISLVVWAVVGMACSPFILMRSSGGGGGSSPQTARNLSYSYGSNASRDGCFKDLPTRRLSRTLAVAMMASAELLGFLIPLMCILCSSARIARSLYKRQPREPRGSAARGRVTSVTSGGCPEKSHERQTDGEKRRALRMVLSCTALFLFCFGPYHVNFLLYLMVSQGIISNCAARLAIRQFHPVSLCLASLSCCLNPLLYYFLAAEFRRHLTIRTSSFSSSLLSSPVGSPTHRPAQQRLMSMESNCSE
ncbi:putative P2Y purinoceptor 10 [Betta splendens]|uniref:P2Y purinoceptor 10 n=1 Tax=Betta splendens TaxID=158456 RepID=A0A9W2Y339_BETSP|nr:putative P2Y purinoceptor 10 [Betta splendens]XP_055368414.1 putative P2Y purinoceptor 10 [Betta splendens]XP_055368415.1 putative P2Y purinoceptor 10 [Betta splendens]XP_055368416.1 putative P2Y purinoceptor 10 [Betta splendens]